METTNAADTLLDAARIPGEPRFFVLGCWERNVSIYLQQVRALNLAYGLLTTGQISPGSRIAVVGGGFAGLTAAAALGHRGCDVHLFEKQPRLLHWQQGNMTRWIHPHIHEWPRPGSQSPDAGLPLLNWSADLAGRVAEKALTEFSAVPVQVTCNAGNVTLESLEPFDLVILALGLGVEKSFGALPLSSYWTDDSIGMVQTGPLRRILVSGVGEGGLIDTLYLRLRDFRHDATVRDCLSVPGIEAVEEELLAIESDVVHLDPSASTPILSERYSRLPVPAEVDDRLRARLRTDTHVTLNGGGASFLTNKADILNRFLIHRLIQMGDVPYVQGKITGVEADEGRYTVCLDTSFSGEFARVLIRHGTVPTLQQHFSGLWEKYLEARRGKEFLEALPAWTEGYFRSSF